MENVSLTDITPSIQPILTHKQTYNSDQVKSKEKKATILLTRIMRQQSFRNVDSGFATNQNKNYMMGKVKYFK